MKGPLVTVLSAKRCSEMRGKKAVKMFVVFGEMTRKDGDDEKEEGEKTKRPQELCKCAQIKEKLLKIYHKVGSVRQLFSRNKHHLVKTQFLSRVIFYTKITVLTEMVNFIKGIPFPFPSV